jgi:mRNA interferase MazF
VTRPGAARVEVVTARGDIVVVATRGAYSGKPRPTLVVQSDLFNETHASVTVCPITSDCIDAPLFRVSVPPGVRTGLHASSQVMVDKVVSVPRSSIAKRLGRCESAELGLVDDALRRWLALE